MTKTGTATLALALALVLAPRANATPDTINLTDVTDIDHLPVCAEEDCSDQIGQTGVWLDTDTGTWYLERGEDYTRMIIDNTTVDHGTAHADGAAPGSWTWGDDNGYDAGYESSAYDLGAYVGGWN